MRRMSLRITKKGWNSRGERYLNFRYVDNMLYEMFKTSGSNLSTTTSKVLALDRIYLTQFSRRGREDYTAKVAQAIYESPFCRGLARVVGVAPFPNDTNIYKYHKDLTDVIYSVGGKNETVFASKWLHFHFPLAFPIMDKRANDILIEHLPNLRCNGEYTNFKDSLVGNFDLKYVAFSFRLKKLREEIMRKLRLRNSSVTVKELDKFLYY